VFWSEGWSLKGEKILQIPEEKKREIREEKKSKSQTSNITLHGIQGEGSLPCHDG
jgi:hypothetical protein